MSAPTSLVRAAMSDISPAATADGKTVKRALLHSRRTFRRALKVSSPRTAWLADNALLLESAFDEAISGIRSVGTVHCDNAAAPVLFTAFRAYLSLSDAPLNESAVAAFINALDGDETYTFADYDALPTLFLAACLCELGKACAASDEDIAERLSVLVPSVTAVRRYPYERAYAVCAGEKLLLHDRAGMYALQTEKTKRYYRKRAAYLAKIHGQSECAYIRSLLEASQNGDTPRTRHIGFYLYPRRPRFLPLLFCLTAFLAAFLITLPFLAYSPFAVFCLYPLYEASRLLLSALVGKLYARDPVVLPSLDLAEIPDTDAVFVVITSLLGGKRSDAALFDRLERIYHACGGRNVLFGVLGDLPDSKSAVTGKDETTVKYALDRVEALNRRYGKHFYLAVRMREYAPSEGKFMGHERKRGAVCDFVRLLCGENVGRYRRDAILPGASVCGKVRYVVTLDADTEMSFDSVREMAGLMLHPLNTPVVDHKRRIVTDGFGVLQPRMTAELSAANKSVFSALCCAPGGSEPYPSDVFDSEDALSGMTTFCGKGMFDKYAFYDTVINAFPDRLVLSHDILEGERLRCMAARDVCFSDGFPVNELSFFKRHHRWVRGDAQNLVFVCPRVPTADGKAKNPLPIHSRFRLLDNVRRALLPVFSTALLLVSPFLSVPLHRFFIVSALLPYALPFLLSLRGVKHIARRFFAARTVSSIWLSPARTAYDIASLPKNAAVTLDALVRAVIRIKVTGHRTLEWVTAAQSDAEVSDGFLAFVRRNLSAAFAGAFLLIFSFGGALRLIGLMWFVFPTAAYLLSKRETHGTPVTEADKAQIRGYAGAQWRFFEYTVGADDHFLPPDHVRCYPTEHIAHRTSPTNIGLYLLSVLAARDFGFIDTETLYARVEHTLSTIETLEKRRGHLYNWYDTVTTEVLNPRYVSSVDSGNLLCCLTALKEGLKDYAGEKALLLTLVGRIQKLIDGADIGYLYDASKHLFSLGVTVKENGEEERSGVCYDLLMSESRLFSYFSVARKAVPKRHWQTLGRPLIGKRGHIGLSSWTGTAFEYTMPSLLLPVYGGSVSYEAICFALAETKRRAASFGGKAVCGVSESGYFDFDNGGGYRYKAFGVPSLALCRGQERENVVAPYASFLFLPFDVRGMLKNLSYLRDGGAYDQFGFYEAVDCTRRRTGGTPAVVKSYMAHHVGMSLVACANVCHDQTFVTRFLRDGAMNGARDLLAERIPIDAPLAKTHKDVRPERPDRHGRPHSGSMTERDIVFGGDGQLRFAATKGNVLFSAGDRCVTDPGTGLDIRYTADGTSTNALTDALLYDAGGAAVYEKRFHEHRYKTVFLCLDGGSVFAVQCSSDKRDTMTEIAFSPILLSDSIYASHTAFHALFVTSDYDAAHRVLFYTRKPRGAEHPVCLAVGTGGGEFDFAVRKAEDGDPLYPNTDGASLPPYCAMRFSLTNAGNGSRGRLYLALGKDKDTALKHLDAARGLPFDALMAQTAAHHASLDALYDMDAPQTLRYAERMLKACINPVRRQLPFDANPDVRALWRYGISGDLPLFGVTVPSASFAVRLAPIFHAYARLAACGYRMDILCVCRETERYGAPVTRAVKRLLASLGLSDREGRRGGGIFILSDGEFADTDAYRFRTDDILTDPPYEAAADPYAAYHTVTQGERLPGDKRNVLFPCGSGFFDTDGGYVTDSSLPVRAPQSMVLAGFAVGSVVTHDSLGYTFFGNAALRRITAFPSGGETLYLMDGDALYDLIQCAAIMRVTPGEAVYEGKAAGVSYRISVFAAAKHAVKLIDVETSRKCRLLFSVRPVMGREAKTNRYTAISPFEDHAAFVCRASEDAEGYTGFVTAGNAVYEAPPSGRFSGCAVAKTSCDTHVTFALGVYRTEAARKELFAALRHIPSLYDAAKRFAARFSPCVTVSGEGIWQTVSPLFNTFLPCQTVVCRLIARSGFYQSGGAYGFRDQLQDALAVLYASPDLARAHILRAASHTFEDGSALHWWHPSPDGHDKGIRSRCSDDYLFLPYCTAKYILTTGDKAILSTPLRTRTGDTLEDGESEKYLTTRLSDNKSTLYDICIKALRRGYRLIGEHGLPLLGSGDWCDGLNTAGKGMKGESVWVGQFLIVTTDYVLRAFPSLPVETASFLSSRAALLRENLEKHAYSAEHERYIRAWYDDGTPIGLPPGTEDTCELLPQAFAVFAGVPTSRARTVMRTAYEKLYDEKYKLFRLFSPPFSEGLKRPGYVAGYVEGVRENGGQYTHAAVWGCMAMLRAALGGEEDAVDEEMLEKSVKAFAALYPSVRCTDTALAKTYRIEPYAAAADIYTEKSLIGFGGWSWYTGTAGWLWTAALNELFGVTLTDMLTAAPHIHLSKAAFYAPFVFDTLPTLTLQLEKAGAVVIIRYDRGTRGVLLDGVAAERDVTVGAGEHVITVGYGKHPV